MKKGDEVICIQSYNTVLTDGEKYTIAKVYMNKVSILLEHSPGLYGVSSYLKSRFKTIEEIRDEKIDNILK